MNQSATDFQALLRAQALHDDGGELAIRLDMAIAEAILRDDKGKSGKRVMEARLCVSKDMQATLSDMFPEASLVYRDFDASADGDFETLRSFLMQTLYGETMEAMLQNGRTVVSISNDIYDRVSNARSLVTLCPTSLSNKDRVYLEASDARIHSLYRAHELQDLRGASGGGIASYAEYQKYVRDQTGFYTTVGSGRKFDVMVHDCFYSQLSQPELAFLTYSFGAKMAYFYIPYIPEVFFSLSSDKYVVLPDYGMAYFISEKRDVLRVRSLNCEFVEMEYSLRVYKQMLYRKVVRIGKIMAAFEQRTRYGRFLCCSLTITTDERVLTGSPEYHSVSFLFEGQSAFRRYHLRRGSDVSDPRSYDEVYFMAPLRAVMSTRDFARKVDRDSFTPRAIRRRLASFVQRTIVGGTTLKFEDFVSSDDLTGLVNWIFSEAYVSRFLSGETLKILQKDNEKTFGLADAPISFRVYAAVCGMSSSLYDSTVASVLQYMHEALTTVRLNNVRHLDSRPVDFPTQLIICETVMPKNSSYALSIVQNGDFSQSGPLAFVDRSIPELNRRVSRRAVRTTVSTEMQFRHTDMRHYDAITAKVEQGNDYTRASNYIGFDTPQTVYQSDVDGSKKFAHVDDVINVLNDAYRSMYPDQHKYPMTVNQLIFSVSAYDLNIKAPYYEIQPYHSVPYRQKAYFESKLKGPKQIPVQQTSRNLMQALNNRQMGPPDIDEAIDLSANSNQETLNVMMRRFFVSYCLPDWEERLAVANYSFFLASYEAVAAKLKNLDPHKLEKWKQYDGHFTDMRQNVMKCMIKSVNKPPDAVGGHLKVDKTQTIIYDESYAATEFGIALESSLSLLEAVMRPEVMWLRRKEPDALRKHAQTYDPFESDTCYLEADISRCDKSFKQYMLVTLIDELFRVLRMNVLTRYAWYTSMDAVRVKAMEAGIRFTLAGQIKSGFFCTWLCNVFGVQIAFANAFQLFRVPRDRGLNPFDISKWFKSPILADKRQPPLHVEYRYHYIMATGDDGLVCLTQAPSRDERLVLRDYMSKVANLEAKVIVSQTPYFASGYLLIDTEEELAHFVPNPIKILEKKSYEVNAANPKWHDYWQSLKDSLSCLGDPRIRQLLSNAVQVRNERQLPLMRDAIDALYQISQDADGFRDLYTRDMIKL